MNFLKFFHSIELGFKSLLLHKLRSSLTVLGIIFGVCSVITMLAVGEGASHEAQQRIKELGSNNILIETVKPGDTEEEKNTSNKYGLTEVDCERIRSTVDGVESIIPARLKNAKVLYKGNNLTVELVGTNTGYAKANAIHISKGRYLTDIDYEFRNDVCVISQSLANDLFSLESALGKSLRIDDVAFQIIGILEEQGETKALANNKTIHIPLSTLRMRYGNVTIKRSAGNFSAEEVELHKITIQMKNAQAVLSGESQIRQILKHGHKKLNDYKILVPLQLLKQAEQTKKMFNIVLGSIAAISLLVGGIGIMNIMLATVTERTREIGIRRALGAKKTDIITQFMIESVILSLCGGLIGVLLGIATPQLIAKFTELHAIVSPISVVIAFVISALIGIVFGIYPAAKSAQLDPIEALRNE